MLDFVIRRTLMLSWEGRVPSRVAAALAVTFAILVGGVSSALAAGATHAGARHDVKHGAGRGTSTNWSGYAVDGTGASQVQGTWTEPAVTCAPGENSWSSPWVGIDGDNSNSVEQIGTDSDCRSGKPVYYAWYEMYPKPLVTINMGVHPGDSFTGAVTYNSSTGSFTLTLTDTTTPKVAPFTTIQSPKKVARSSVEWVMEGPSNGLLSDFGSAVFSAGSATINNQSAGLSALAGAQPITMVNNAGDVRSQPSALSANGFSLTWHHS